MLLVQSREILVSEYFLVECDGVFVGPVHSGDAGELIAVQCILAIFLVISQFLLRVPLKFPYASLALAPEFLLNLFDVILPDVLDADEVDFGVAFDLE